MPLHLIIVKSPIGIFAHRLYEHRDDIGVQQTTKGHECSCLPGPLHETCYGLYYPNQIAKTTAKLLYQGYILIFGALAKLLSDQGPNFMSNIIWELCELMGIKKIRTLPYHAQTNGHMECTHQTIMQMIGKLGKDQKADWPNHSSEMVQAYNSTRSAVTGYSPHYLIFG